MRRDTRSKEGAEERSWLGEFSRTSDLHLHALALPLAAASAAVAALAPALLRFFIDDVLSGGNRGRPETGRCSACGTAS